MNKRVNKRENSHNLSRITRVILMGLMLLVIQPVGATKQALVLELPQVSDMWLRAAPPNAKMMAAYVTVFNNTEQQLKVVGAFAPDFDLTEIHNSVEQDGLLKMREQKELSLPAQSNIVMEPGGLHIMLMMPDRKFAVGDEVKICLVYEDESGAEHVQHLYFPVLKK